MRPNAHLRRNSKCGWEGMPSVVVNIFLIQSKQRNKASFDMDKTFEIIKKQQPHQRATESRLNAYFKWLINHPQNDSMLLSQAEAISPLTGCPSSPPKSCYTELSINRNCMKQGMPLALSSPQIRNNYFTSQLSQSYNTPPQHSLPKGRIDQQSGFWVRWHAPLLCRALY